MKKRKGNKERVNLKKKELFSLQKAGSKGWKETEINKLKKKGNRKKGRERKKLKERERKKRKETERKKHKERNIKKET